MVKRLTWLLLYIWITVNVTAYTPYECSNKHTASGTIPKAGRTIAASRHIPMGTRVYIPSRGWYRVEDRMARRYDRGSRPRIDIFMTNRKEALKCNYSGKAYIPNMH